MANDRTLHIKIDSETDLKLRRLSDIRRKSKGTARAGSNFRLLPG